MAASADIIYVLIFIEIRNAQTKRQLDAMAGTKSRWERIGGNYHRNREHDRMEQARKTWRLMNSCRDRSDGNRSRSSIPARPRYCLLLLLPLLLHPLRTRILIIHTSLPLHFISYCCHCILLSISITITICDLFTCTACLPSQPACCCLLPMALVPSSTQNYAWSATSILRPHNGKGPAI